VTRKRSRGDDDDDRVAEVKWEAPPEKGTRYDWAAIADQLRAQPMTWAKIFDDDRTSVVNAIRQGNIQAVRPDHGFQVRTANNTRGVVRKCTLYLRYNPGNDGTRKGRRNG